MTPLANWTAWPIQGPAGVWSGEHPEYADYRWPHQTRIFTLGAPAPVTAVALVPEAALAVDQWELLDGFRVVTGDGVSGEGPLDPLPGLSGRA